MTTHRFTTPLLLLLLLTACTDSREQQLQLEELERQNRADSVMQDLALAQSLADHFDRHGTRNEQLRAHYILGRTACFPAHIQLICGSPIFTIQTERRTLFFLKSATNILSS